MQFSENYKKICNPSNNGFIAPDLELQRFMRVNFLITLPLLTKRQRQSDQEFLEPDGSVGVNGFAKKVDTLPPFYLPLTGIPRPPHPFSVTLNNLLFVKSLRSRPDRLILVAFNFAAESLLGR